MGPCFRGMENGGTLVHHGNSPGPSMGPCFRGMENAMTKTCPSGSVNLQWGHALGAWKTATRGDGCTWNRSPSMGPCFRGMENGWDTAFPGRESGSFNGAML